MGTFQEQAGIKPLPANQPSHAITDISENMRAKIYALFCKIGKSQSNINIASLNLYQEFSQKIFRLASMDNV